MTDRERVVIHAMRDHGGSFVKALAQTMLLADDDNFTILRNGFASLWDRYAAMGQRESLATERGES
jgi:hypothetical protein